MSKKKKEQMSSLKCKLLVIILKRKIKLVFLRQDLIVLNTLKLILNLIIKLMKVLKIYQNKS